MNKKTTRYSVEIAGLAEMDTISPANFRDVGNPGELARRSPGLFACIAWKTGLVKRFPVGFMLYFRTEWGIALVFCAVAVNSRGRGVGSLMIDWAKQMLDAGDVVRTTVPTCERRWGDFVRSNGFAAIRRQWPEPGVEAFEYQCPPPATTAKRAQKTQRQLDELNEKRGAVRA